MLNNQKHLKVTLNTRHQMLKNQQDDVTKFNQTKELEKINADLAHKVSKLE